MTAAGERDGGSDDAAGAALSARAGATLGRYLLGEVLGRGAMATVFRARDRQLGRTVAVKVMTLAVAARPDAGERFRREAQAVAALRHPGIVEIYDFSPATDADPAYIVAELIDGPTLSELLGRRRGRVLPELAVLVGAEISEAVAAAHERGIVHRDIKPDNVMVEKTAAGSRVVITDFGVAHVTGLESMTATGALVGSPAYMSPEQARGQDAGRQADVWAVGVLLYQMVTGVLPFPGREPFAVIAAICRGDFRRPSHIQAMVAPELEQIILRCLAPDPERRGDGASGLARELRKLARDAGLEDAPAALRRFLDDPEGFEADLRPRVANAAVERARRHVRRGELARALAHVGRATAYVPDHRAAAALLASISRRRRWMKAAAALAAVGVLAGGSYARWRSHEQMKKVVATIVRAPPAAAVQAAPPPAVAPAVVAAAARPKPGHRPRVRRPAAPVPEPIAAAPDPTPSPPPPVAPPAPGRVSLLAWHAFCFPSLDDTPVSGHMPALYPTVTPGEHRVFCSLDRGGPKDLVGKIVVPAGATVERHIVRGPDLKPQFKESE